MFAYSVPLAVTLLVGFVLGSHIADGGDASRPMLLRIYLSAFVTLWLAGSIMYSRWNPAQFGVVVAGLAVLTIPMSWLAIAMTEGRYSHAAFVIGLFLWCGVAVWSVWDEVVGLERFLTVLAVVWSVAGSIISLGTLPVLPYSLRAIEGASSLHIFLDIRVTLTVVLAAAVAVVAFQRVWGNPIKVPAVPRRLLPPTKDEEPAFWRVVLRPFIELGNAFLRTFYALVGVLWGLAFILFVFFGRIGREMVGVLKGVFTRRLVVATVVTVVGTYLLLTTVYYVAVFSSPTALRYIRAAGVIESLSHIGPLVANGVIATLCVSAIVWMVEEERSDVVEAAGMALMFLLSMLVVTALLLVGGSRIQQLELEYFRDLGPFSIGLLMLVLLGMFVRKPLDSGE